MEIKDNNLLSGIGSYHKKQIQSDQSNIEAKDSYIPTGKKIRRK